MNSLPGMGLAAVAVGRRRIVGGQEEQDFGLNRIGVLELVDEDARELALQMPRTVGVAPDEIARARPADRRSRASPRPPSAPDSAPSRPPAPAAGTRPGRHPPSFLNCCRSANSASRAGEHLGARDVLAVLVAAALPRAREAAVAHEVDEARFPAVVDRAGRTTARAESAGSGGGRASVSMNRLSRSRRRPRREIGETMQRGDEAIDLTVAVERRPPPRRRKVAPLGEARPALRSRSIGPSVSPPPNDGRARPPQRPAQTLRRIAQRVLQPGAKGARRTGGPPAAR